MPILGITVPEFPNVPPLPGVPNLNSLIPSFSLPTIPGLPSLPNLPGLPSLPSLTSLLTKDGPGVGAGGPAKPAAPQWGVFDQYGNAALVPAPDSYISFSFMKDYRVSDFPQEDGAFQSYNKVETPFDAKLVVSVGGNTSNRSNFLDLLDTLVSDTNLYTIVTPEKTYFNANIVHHDMERSSQKGVQLLPISIFFREIGLAVNQVISDDSPSPNPAAANAIPSPLANVQAPAGVSKVIAGAVQAAAPIQAAQSAITSAVGSEVSSWQAAGAAIITPTPSTVSSAGLLNSISNFSLPSGLKSLWGGG